MIDAVFANDGDDEQDAARGTHAEDVVEVREVTDNGVVATERASGKLFGNTASIVQLR